MGDVTTYRQCELRRPAPASGAYEGGDQIDVAWVPAHFARPGKWLRIGDDERSWRVTEVYSGTTLTTEELLRRRENLKRFQFVLGD